MQRVVAPEIYGFEKIDSLSYYTNRLVELNKKVRVRLRVEIGWGSGRLVFEEFTIDLHQ